MDRVVFILPAAMSLLALAHLPYGYYQLLRLVVTICAAVISYAGWSVGGRILPVTFGMIALIFNPILPLHLTRDIWAVLNLIAASLFLIGLWWFSRPTQGRADGLFGVKHTRP